MPYPTQPGLTLTVLSSTSFQATIAGADGGTTNTVYVRRIGQPGADLVGGSIVGNGSLIVTGLAANAGYLAWVVSDDGASKSLPAIGAVSLAQSDTVSGAIVALFRADPAIATVCPQLFAQEVPERDSQGKALQVPFGVVQVPDEVPEWNFEGNYHEVAQARILLYGRTLADADRMAAAFKQSYDWQALPFATVRSIQMMRTRSAFTADTVVDDAGNRVWERALEYQVMATRSQ